MLNRRSRTLGSRPVSIRPHLAWYWRSTIISAVVIGFLATAYGMFEYGRRIVSVDAWDTERERAELRARVSTLESELAQLRALAYSSDSRLQVEKTAQTQLASQLKRVEEDNARMKEELAFFENIVPGGKNDDRLTIHRFRVEANGMPGEYRYRLLVLAGTALEGREFNGSVQLVLNAQREERNTVITLPDRGAADPSYRLRFKRIQRVEGSFRVDPNTKVRAVQVRVLEQGSNQPRATENYTLS